MNVFGVHVYERLAMAKKKNYCDGQKNCTKKDQKSQERLKTSFNIKYMTCLYIVHVVLKMRKRR